MRKDLILYKGNSFNSYLEFSKFYNIPYAKLCRQLKRGTSLSKIVKTKASPLKIRYNGKTYNSKSELARVHNISSSLLHSRLHNGKTVKESLMQDTREIKVKDKVYKNLKDLCDKLDIPYRKAYYQIKEKGLSLPKLIQMYSKEREASGKCTK